MSNLCECGRETNRQRPHGNSHRKHLHQNLPGTIIELPAVIEMENGKSCTGYWLPQDSARQPQ
jgi:hypothetical protein